EYFRNTERINWAPVMRICAQPGPADHSVLYTAGPEGGAAEKQKKGEKKIDSCSGVNYIVYEFHNK
ncbi:hypothetical protein QQP08_007476, partial [Theobroma cacao]